MLRIPGDTRRAGAESTSQSLQQAQAICRRTFVTRPHLLDAPVDYLDNGAVVRPGAVRALGRPRLREHSNNHDVGVAVLPLDLCNGRPVIAWISQEQSLPRMQCKRRPHLSHSCRCSIDDPLGDGTPGFLVSPGSGQWREVAREVLSPCNQDLCAGMSKLSICLCSPNRNQGEIKH